MVAPASKGLSLRRCDIDRGWTGSDGRDDIDEAAQFERLAQTSRNNFLLKSRIRYMMGLS
jgi:hypothetical protein